MKYTKRLKDLCQLQEDLNDGMNQLCCVDLGPVSAAFNDFWRMVWEQNTYTIVMVTNLIEKSRVSHKKIDPDLFIVMLDPDLSIVILFFILFILSLKLANIQDLQIQ